MRPMTRDEIEVKLHESRAKLKVYQELGLAYSWGMELQRYAALLGKVQKQWYYEKGREYEGRKE